MNMEAQDVLSFWFDGEQKELYRSKWFPPDNSEKQRTMDELITTRFRTLLQQAERDELSAWKTTRDSFVALIVLLDQFSRHIYRHENREQLRKNDALAVSLSHTFVSQWPVQQLPVPYFVFVMMPIRHSPTPDNLRALLKTIEHRTCLQDDHVELLTKFRKTTINRLSHLRGEVAMESDADILERPFMETDESDLSQHRLYRAMHTFLLQQQAHQYTHLCVSLSGGVDSMVVAYLLHHLRPLHNNYKVVAVHLDYGNRVESGMECEYVRQWCGRYGMIFHVCAIGQQILRATSKRDDYERVSRDIRYGFYHDIMQQHGAPGMCVGHHRGDVQENVISNMMKGQSVLNLNGMAETSIVNGVMIWRPLLAFEKQVIFDFAHQYGIPYFKDTTPLWSTRGKLRTKLVPLLQEMYGEGVLTNLSNLGAESMQCAHVMNQSILEPIMSSVGTSEAAVWLDCTKLESQPVFVWKEILRTVCHTLMGNAMIREKPIQELRTKLARHEGIAQWITLKKGNRSFLTHDKILVLFRDHLFKPSPIVKTSVELGETIEIGRWRIKTTWFDQRKENEKQRNILIHKYQEKKTITLWEFVQTSEIEYVLPYTKETKLIISSEYRLPHLRMKEKAVTDVIPLITIRNPVESQEWIHVKLIYRNRAN